MKLSTLALSAAIAVAFGAAAFAPHAARAATSNPVSNGSPDGTITFTGQVIAQTCQVNGSSAGTAANLTVALDDVLSSQLASAGAVAGKKPFSLDISGCGSDLSSVQAFFGGGNIASNGNLDNTGSASNVQVQLLNGASAAMDLTGADADAQNSLAVSLSGGSATLDFYAQYYANGVAGAGDVNTTATFTMVYE